MVEVMEEEQQSELINEKENIKFILDFIGYWKSVKTFIKPDGKSVISWRKWKEISRKMVDELTRPFFEKWKHLETVYLIEEYYVEHSSFVFSLRGNQLLFPYQLILFEAWKSSDSLISSLKKNPSTRVFEKVLNSLFVDLNVRLRKSDYQIIRKLAQPGFSKSLDRFPKLKELAYGTRQDVRTVSNSLKYLFQHNVLSLIYLVDMARIGYQTELIFHKKSKILTNLEPYIAHSFPLTTHGGFSTVIQYPYRDTSAYLNLIEFFDSEDKVQMHFFYRGWNFGGFTQNPDERWKLKPPLLEVGGNWNTQLIVGEIGIEFNLNPLYNSYPLSYREGRLLGLVHKHSAMAEENLVKQLQVSRSYIAEDWKKLLRNSIIFRYPVFSNIGLGSKVHFCIRINSSKTGGIRNILEHLKFFPYVEMIYNLEEGIVVGKVKIPLSWTNDFIYRLSDLRDNYQEYSYYYYIGPDVYAPWAFDILGTFDWHNYQ